MIERRRIYRNPVHHRVSVTLREDSSRAAADNTTLFCSTEDLSANGLRFKSAVPLTVDGVLDLLLVIGWAYWGFELQGQVRWIADTHSTAPFAVGLQFIGVPEATRIALCEALEKALPPTAQPAASAAS
jgi:hypothetical protein